MKGRIIDCSLKVLAAFGFRKFTMDRVAADLQISKRTIYLHFSSKDELLETCLEEWLHRKRLLVRTGGNLIDDLCMLRAAIRTLDLPRIMRCCRELRQCSAPVHRFLLARLFDYAEACGAQAELDVNTGYLCRTVSQQTVCTVVSDLLIRLFCSDDVRPLLRGYSFSPDILVVFTRGLCTIKGRAYLDQRLKTLS
ncbi:TetR/AcrR family transcriptional regulator [Alistipes sp.]|uniref:TetR/AcrR family transcriptional regulator n=1 Tax=Alistipes sp. TaxID=1872444 RepID=UPI0025C39DD0|nr:TetR/AcrR family transcriptional regulator [Alistipes sp.]MCI7139680.1 TetR/AcrR family transcriptional regulator [Alistipes sp.]MDY5396645.1 helix-turn-helix domain-containing protein [Alistipes sp.]